ncbi:unnamed protein product [Mesocestoides corti]|nr:unnamed protein product [Mesocestoides corti]
MACLLSLPRTDAAAFRQQDHRAADEAEYEALLQEYLDHLRYLKEHIDRYQADYPLNKRAQFLRLGRK